MKKAINPLIIAIVMIVAIGLMFYSVYYKHEAVAILSLFCIGAVVVLIVGALCEHISEQLQ